MAKKFRQNREESFKIQVTTDINIQLGTLDP